MYVQLTKTIPPKYNYLLLEHKLHSKQIKWQIKVLVSDSADILCIAESNLGESILNSEIGLEGFKKPH